MTEITTTPEAVAGRVARTQTKAGVLVEALPYIREFAGSTFVVKVGGEIADDLEGAASFAADLVLLKHVGIDVVLVHGGGPQISRMMTSLGHEPVFRDGLRVTDAATLEVTAMVLLGEVNRRLVGLINVHGPQAVGLSGLDGRLFGVVAKDPALGFVGEIVSVSTDPVRRLLDDGYIPVIATLGIDDAGDAYNINADTAAGALAAALGAEKLLAFTNVEGIYEDFGDPESLVSEIDADGLRRMADDGKLSAGMLPKVAALLDAIDAGVPSAAVLDGRVRHALLLEIFTPEGIGTKIVPSAGASSDSASDRASDRAADPAKENV